MATVLRSILRPPGALRSGIAVAGFIAGKVTALEARVLDCHALVLLLGGGGWFEDPTGRQSVKTGDCLVLFPGIRHGYGPEESGSWSEAFLVGYGPLFEALVADGLLDQTRPVLRPGVNVGLSARFGACVTAHRAGAEPQRLLAEVHTLVADLVARDRAGSSAEETFIERACARLVERLDAPIDFQHLAREFACTEAAFRKRFARAVGEPPSRWRARRRIEAAKHLLVEEGATLAAVAERLGFCDQFFFARQFRHVTGRSPGAFRDAFRRGS